MTLMRPANLDVPSPPRCDWGLLLLSGGILAIGYLAIQRAEELAGWSPRFSSRQVIWGVGALVVGLTAAVTNYRWLRRWSYGLLGLSLVLLLLVYFFPPVNGARRWIRFGPAGFQPSELAKLATIAAVARYLAVSKLDSWRTILGSWGLVMGPLLLILREPDLGTALLFVPILLAMLFVGGISRKRLGLVLLIGFALLPLLWSQMSREQKSRITALLEPSGPRDAISDDAFHLRQAKQMIALGGWLGSWAFDEQPLDAAVYRLPEIHTDSIACVLIERNGLLGLAGLLMLYALLIGRIGRIASQAEPFGRLLLVGIATLLASQMMINLGMMLGLLPITGLALPLVSYGGSNLVATGFALGTVASVGKRGRA